MPKCDCEQELERAKKRIRRLEIKLGENPETLAAKRRRKDSRVTRQQWIREHDSQPSSCVMM